MSLCQSLSLSLCACPVYSWYVFSVLFKIIIKKSTQISASFDFVASVQFHFYHHFKNCIIGFSFLLLYLDPVITILKWKKHLEKCPSVKYTSFLPKSILWSWCSHNTIQLFILSKNWEMAVCHNFKGWLTIAKALDAKDIDAKVFKALGNLPSLIFSGE